MKKIVSFLILAFFFMLPSASFALDDAAWDKGLRELRDKDYAAAVATFESIIADGSESASLYHNLSLAYAGEGKAGQAALAKERALMLKPNLYANRFWDGWRLPTNYMLLLGCVAFWHIVFFSLARFFAEKRKILRTVFICTWSVWLIACIYGVWQHHGDFSKAVIVSAGKSLKVSPTAHSPDATAAREGESVHILERQNDWLKVKTANNDTGWIATADCIPVFRQK